jgi:hypothetical protein
MVLFIIKGHVMFSIETMDLLLLININVVFQQDIHYFLYINVQVTVFLQAI